MVTGTNDGGPSRTKLKYAVSDANSLMKVLNEMGGVFPQDSQLLVEPDKKKFISGMNILKEKINKAKATSQRIEVIFYYSGHSDEEAILLGKERISYKDIKDFISSLPVDVRIAILDSCSSGAFTRLKGGKMRMPFMVDSAYNMKGYAFMTSSSLDEASQESDRIKGSFFTHYLLSGLRGAADMTQDGRITLSEAYQFAYNETLAGTEKTMSGPQHPNYYIQMSGTGDVIMTDIRKSSAMMIISEDISGKLFIRDMNNNLVCELRKPHGRSMQFGLGDGNYTIINIREGKLYEANVRLIFGEQVLLSQNDFKISGKEYATARGDVDKDNKDNKDSNEEEYKIVPWDFSFVPRAYANAKTIHYYSFNLIGSYSARLDGLSLGIGPGIVSEDVRGFQLNAVGNLAGTHVEGAQLSNVFNLVHKNLMGLQLAGIFNFAGNSVKGAQISSIFNIDKGNTTGLQLSGIFNHTREKLKGSQISAIYNYSGEEVKGLQLAGITNISGNTKGAQISLTNIADDFQGVQLGLVNISKTQKGVPVGLINVSENGGIEIVFWGSSLIAGNTGIIFRANYIYTMISAGWMNLDQKIDNSLGCGFHFGAHLPAASFFIDTDIGLISIDNKKIFSGKENTDQQALQARLIIGYYISADISIFAGAGINYIYDNEFYNDRSYFKDGKLSPLYFAGVKYSLFGKKL